MAHLSAVPIVLGDEERRALEGLMRGHTTPQQMALRARMILHCDDGVGVREIARRLGVWPKTVRRWHKRWLSSAPGVAVAARLSDAPKSGAPVGCAEERRAGQVRRRADLRHHRHRLRAAVGQRPADHPVVAAGGRRRGDATRHRGQHLATLGGALF